MPRKTHQDLEIDGLTYRLHRVRGFASFEGRGAIVTHCGEETALIMSDAVLTAEMREKLASSDGQAITAMVVIAGSLQRKGLTRTALRELTSAFLLGWLEVKQGDEWRRIDTTDDLDEILDAHDGEADDGLVWATLLWTQIPNTLRPTIAASGTE